MTARKQPTLRDMLASVLTRLDALESAPKRTRAQAPAKAVAVEQPNPFVAFLAGQHAAALAAGTHVRCEQPKCNGTMNIARTTRINGKRACRKHF